MLNIRTLVAAATIIALTGCITIEENYTFKKNGSGTMTYVVDMSEMGDLLKSFGDGEKAEKPEGLGNMDMTTQVDALKQIPGIAKVKLDNKKEWIQKVSFSFTDIAALNKALAALMPDTTGVTTEYFRWDNGVLVRKSNPHLHQIAAGMATEGAAEDDNAEEGSEGFDMASILSSMKYKYSFKFQQSITSTDAAGTMAKEAKGTKEVALSTDWASIAKDPNAMDLRITLGN